MTATPFMPYPNGVGVVSGDNLDAFVQTVVSADQLRTLTGDTGISITLLGYVTPGDGGEGGFYWDATSTGPDNGISVIMPTGATVGAWIRYGLSASDFALADLSNVADSDFRAKGVASGLALDDLSNVSDADFYAKAVEAGVVSALTGPIYNTLAEGLIATTDGDVFSVLLLNGDGADLFVNVSGSGEYRGTAPIGNGVALYQSFTASLSPLNVPEATTIPFVDIQPILGVFFDGRLAPNTMTPLPGRNYINGSAFLGNPDVAPEFVTNYAKLTLTGSGDIIRFSPLVTGRHYHMALTAKSPAGDGSQSIVVGAEGAASPLTITEGADSVYNQEITIGGTPDAIIYNNGTVPVTALIKYVPQIVQRGETVANAATEVRNTFALQSQNTSSPGDITFDGSLLVTPFNGSIPLSVDGSDVTLSEATFMLAIQKTAPGTGGNFQSVVATDDFFTLSLGDVSNTLFIECIGFDGADSNKVILGDIQGEGVQLIGARFSATESAMFFEGANIYATGAGTSSTPVAISKLNAGGLYTPFGASSFHGRMGIFRFWDRALSDSDYQKEAARMRAQLSVQGATLQPRKYFWISAGDSITNGFPSFTGYPPLAAPQLDPIMKLRNMAVDGASVNSYIASGTQAHLLAVVESLVADGFTPIVSFLLGQNDVSNQYNTLKTIWANARAAGALVIASTLTSSSFADGTTGQAYSTAIKSDPSLYDALFDFRANAHVGAIGAYLNATYFYNDPHPNQNGQDVMSTAVALPVLQALTAG